MPTALTIAGSDSSGGAGIQADLKTFAALGVYGTSVLTAVTAQNTVAVDRIHPVPLADVAAQIDAVVSDLPPAATKIGMLFRASVIALVADKIASYRLPNVVLDPLLAATTGRALLRPDARAVLIRRLLPLTTVLTPNLPEAAALLGRDVGTLEEQAAAARDLAALGPRAVVVKGGHRTGESIDVLYDGREIHYYGGERIAGSSVHGTGCTFSAALAAYLALDQSIVGAVETAKRYVAGAMREALGIGHGHRVLDHGWLTPEHPIR